MSRSILSQLPRVDRVILHPSLGPLRKRLGPDVITHLARRTLDDARTRVKSGASCPTLEEVVTDVAKAAEGALRQRARPVINATGVLLHTNLGRAPLSPRAAEALAQSAARYTSVELDLDSGRRGRRGAFSELSLAELTGAESALVVNNNAAAVLLALSVIAGCSRPGDMSGRGRPVIVSRGELIEIGGGFRVPEVMERSGARLIEVGTTNRTHLDDYRRALDAEPDAAAILRVHPGNFRQTGFVERPPLRALAGLACERGIVLMKDLGGGALVDLGALGLHGEPTARECIAAGCDLLCFSTDKVLGGPQGGAIVGRAHLVDKARRDPLARALRLGRLPLVALEATLASYLEGTPEEIPTISMMRASREEVRNRVISWKEWLAARGIAVEVIDLDGAAGGGALAEEAIASAGLLLRAGHASDLARKLRTGEPPILARIQDEAVLIDGRTVLPGEEEMLLEGIARAVRGA